MQDILLITLLLSKISNNKEFKDNFCIQSTQWTKKKRLKYMRMHIETIDSQQVQVQVKRALSKILYSTIPKLRSPSSL